MSIDSMRDLNNSLELAISALINARGVKKAESSEGMTSVSEANESMFTFSFSRLGKKVKQLKEEIENIEDEEERKKSRKGFEDVLDLLSDNNDHDGLSKFISLSESLMATSPENYTAFLGVMAEMTSKGLPIKGWLNNLSHLGDFSVKNHYVAETRRILSTNVDDKIKMIDTFSRFVAVITNVIAESANPDQLSSKLNKFFESLEYSEGLEEKDESMTKFVEYNSY